ncbi:F0F1 ATP synthase subunit I [Granulosicoccaceae sp. 1_MG-2023]|nr:F0F1 ATP synthase subunit I [Granulosicoccaceae sp. 1_MG-2023]
MRKKSDQQLIVRRLIVAQVIVVAGVPLVFLITSGTVHAYSALVGTLTCFVPNLYFVYRAFKFRGARAAKMILRSFYAGETIKIMMTAVFFGLAFALIEPINVLAVFGGFIAVQATTWLAPWLVRHRFAEN